MRYLKSRPSRLVSSVSLLSIAGIALGVAALVVAMGLLSGYRTEIREKLIGANAEIVVFPLIAGGDAGSRGARAAAGRRAAGVRATAPVIYQTGVAASAATPDGTDAVLKGIDPAAERRVSELDAYLPDAERVVDAARPARRGRGRDRRRARAQARRPRGRPDHPRRSPTPRAAPGASCRAPGGFGWAEVFRTNFSEYDTEWVFLDREELRRLARMEGQGQRRRGASRLDRATPRRTGRRDRARRRATATPSPTGDR